MKMNVDELIAAVKNCLRPDYVRTCENCTFHGCLEELFRQLDEFALEHKSQEAEIEKLNETISDLHTEIYDYQDYVESLNDDIEELQYALEVWEAGER